MKKTHYDFSNISAQLIFGCIAALTVILLIGIFVFLFTIGIGAFSQISLKEFFLGINCDPTSYHKPSWGILSLVTGTIIVSVIALCIAVPIGFAIAMYLSEIMHSKVKEIIKPLIEMIASIPSVVLGLLGLLFLAPLIAKIF